MGRLEMAAKSSVVIHDYKVDANTGRIELHLKSHTVDGNASWDGPVKQYSIDPQGLRDRFNGDIETFEAWAAGQHESIVGVAPGLAETLEARKGKVIA
jgi:hypothetical protein